MKLIGNRSHSRQIALTVNRKVNSVKNDDEDCIYACA